MEDGIKKYMVEFDVPVPFPEDLEVMISDQRLAVHELFLSEKLLTYTLSLDRTKIWAIFLAQSESELLYAIDTLPMTGYMNYNYVELMFHETIQHIPSMSLN
jgi:hypothetical protein